MPEILFDPVDSVTTGAIGEPGKRMFLIQATRGNARVTVLLEKEQVVLLATRLDVLLDRVAVELPEEAGALEVAKASEEPLQSDEPLFRALALGLGFESQRQVILVELHERPEVPEVEGEGGGESGPDPGEPEGHVVRLFMTRAQARAMVVSAAEALKGGRPLCTLCHLPMDPSGHVCPATNGHKR